MTALRARLGIAGALLLAAAPARAVGFDLTLLGGAGFLDGLPRSWTGEAYSNSIVPTPTGTTLSSSGSAGPCGGWGIQLAIGIPFPPNLTFEVTGLYESLYSGYRPSSLQFSPQSADALAGPMSLGVLALPLQLRLGLANGFSVFAGGGPAVSTLALLVTSPSPETDFEARAFDVDLRLGGDFDLVRWGHDRTSGLAAGLVVEADTNGWVQAVFLTFRLFSGSPDPALRPRSDDGD